MHKINIKPLSVNAAWRGRRFPTDDYKYYKIELGLLLPIITVPEGLLEVYYEFGINMAMDWDSPIKQFQDILQNQYGFNDNQIYKATVLKVPVTRGDEYIKFNIKSYE